METKLNVVLLTHTPNPEQIVAAAARLCYSPVGAAQLLEEMSQRERDNLIRRLIGMGHESPLEHVTFTFAIEGVSRALSHQLVRHRIASYSQQSQRYVKEGNFDYIIPPTIAAQPYAEALFIEAMQNAQESYNILTNLGIPAEDCRFVLPNACETKLVATMNVRALYNFFAHRLCNRAQWEIRELANRMFGEVRAVAPILFEGAGPTCITEGVCHEGKMSCGRAPSSQEVRATYDNACREQERRDRGGSL